MSRGKATVAVWGLIMPSAFGIYLGRFPRWNSWDIVTRPSKFFSHVGELLFWPWEHPVMHSYCFGVPVLMGGGYFCPMLIARSLNRQAGPENVSAIRIHVSLPEKPDAL